MHSISNNTSLIKLTSDNNNSNNRHRNKDNPNRNKPKVKLTPRIPIMGPPPTVSQPKVVTGEHGYVLEDVPHLIDYIPNLPVCFIPFYNLFHFCC